MTRPTFLQGFYSVENLKTQLNVCTFEDKLLHPIKLIPWDAVSATSSITDFRGSDILSVKTCAQALWFSLSMISFLSWCYAPQIKIECPMNGKSKDLWHSNLFLCSVNLNNFTTIWIYHATIWSVFGVLACKGGQQWLCWSVISIDGTHAEIYNSVRYVPSIISQMINRCSNNIGWWRGSQSTFIVSDDRNVKFTVQKFHYISLIIFVFVAMTCSSSAWDLYMPDCADGFLLDRRKGSVISSRYVVVVDVIFRGSSALSFC